MPLQERIARVETAVAKTTRLCEADIANVTDRLRQVAHNSPHSHACCTTVGAAACRRRRECSHEAA